MIFGRSSDPGVTLNCALGKRRKGKKKVIRIEDGATMSFSPGVLLPIFFFTEITRLFFFSKYIIKSLCTQSCFLNLKKKYREISNKYNIYFNKEINSMLACSRIRLDSFFIYPISNGAFTKAWISDPG